MEDRLYRRSQHLTQRLEDGDTHLPEPVRRMRTALPVTATIGMLR